MAFSIQQSVDHIDFGELQTGGDADADTFAQSRVIAANRAYGDPRGCSKPCGNINHPTGCDDLGHSHYSQDWADLSRPTTSRSSV